jgi:hypothetical protein
VKDFDDLSILAKIKSEQPDFVRAQRQTAANICFQLAEHYNQHNNVEKAQGFYNEALRHNEAHEQVSTDTNDHSFTRFSNNSEILRIEHDLIISSRFLHLLNYTYQEEN